MDILFGRSVRDRRHIYTFRGFSADSSTFCCPVKLPPSALGFCSNIVKQEDLNPDFISGPTELPPAMLIGSKWEGMPNMFFESSSCAWFYPSGAAPQYGALTDGNFGDSFEKLPPTRRHGGSIWWPRSMTSKTWTRFFASSPAMRQHTFPPCTSLLCGTPRLPPSKSYRFNLPRLGRLTTVYQQQ